MFKYSVSSLIAELQKVLDEHGDLPVVVSDEVEGVYWRPQDVKLRVSEDDWGLDIGKISQLEIVRE